MGMENLETVIRFLKEKRRLFKIKTCFLAPQQLGLMGMEALETVIGYWEDALAAYNPTGTLSNSKCVLPSQIIVIGGVFSFD